jgi:polyisoprenoid-binding protein YceI
VPREAESAARRRSSGSAPNAPSSSFGANQDHGGGSAKRKVCGASPMAAASAATWRSLPAAPSLIAKQVGVSGKAADGSKRCCASSHAARVSRLRRELRPAPAIELHLPTEETAMKKNWPIGALLAALASLPAQAAETYAVDARHAQVVFGYTHFGFSHQTGMLRQVSGELIYDAADPAKSSVSVTIPIDALSTGVPELDQDLKGANFFDQAQFPTITFKSTRVEKAGSDGLTVTGDLTLHGVTKPVTLAVKLLKSGEHPMKKVPMLGFDATASLKRSEFGIERLTPMVSDDVDIHIAIEATQPAAKK